MPKGDALGVARVAGILAAKRTPDLIPLCHPLPISGVEVELELAADAIEIRARVQTNGRTGVEMEALTVRRRGRIDVARHGESGRSRRRC